MILVTGGTGLVGSHLLYKLVQQHPRVRAIHREKSDLNSVKEVFSFFTDEIDRLFDKIEWIEANVTDIPALETAFEGITYVYHCAAFISFNPKHYRALKKTNIEGTANVINLCLSKKVQKLIHVSSIATLGDPLEEELVSENTHWNPDANNHVYGITKYGAEMEVWRGMEEGLSAAIVNPGVILGEGHWNSGSGLIIKAAAKGTKYYTAGGTGWVDVIDVVDIMVQLMNSEIDRERYILVSENANYLRVLATLSAHFEQPKPSKKVSKIVLLWLSKADYLSSKLFGTKRRLLGSMVESLSTTTRYDSSKIRNDLDHQFQSLEATLSRVSRHYSSKS